MLDGVLVGTTATGKVVSNFVRTYYCSVNNTSVICGEPRKYQSRFCSLACDEEYKTGKPAGRCVRRGGRLKNGKQFCCQDCRYATAHEKRDPCQFCGRVLPIDGGTRFCTQDCYGAFTRTQVKRHEYLYSSGFKGHPLASSNHQVGVHRLALYEELGCQGVDCFHPCEVCGAVLQWGGIQGITVDHINGDKHDNRAENLRVLCSVCNLRKGVQARKLRLELSR